MNQWSRRLATTLLVCLLPAADAALLLEAPLDGSAQCTVGARAGAVVHGARFVPGRKGQAVLAPEHRAGVELPVPAGYAPGRGTLMFWFQPQREFFRDRFNVTLVAPKGGKGLAVYLNVRPSSVTLTGRLKGRPRDSYVRATYNHFRKDRWYHVAVTWEVSAHDMCLWLFGSPQADHGPYGAERMGGFQPARWAPAMNVGSSEAAVDEVRLYDEALTAAQIRREARLGPMDLPADEGRIVCNTSLDVDAVRGELLFADNFDADWRKNWVLEGPGSLRHENGELFMESRKPPGGHIVLWCKREFPGSFVAEWDFTPTQPGGLCIVFFCARGRNGKDLFDPSLAKRDGTFKQYHSGDLNCYHISYYRNTCRRAPPCALRKNFGFFRIMSGPDYVYPQAGVKSHCVLVKRGAHIQFVTNGRVSIDWVDDGKTYGPVWGAGKIGLRQMGHTHGRYDNFRVYAAKDGITGIELR